MAYTQTNFKTKKALKEALASGEEVRVYQPNDMFGKGVEDGAAYLEGPHYPEPHKWYASCKVRDGKVVPGSVK